MLKKVITGSLLALAYLAIGQHHLKGTKGIGMEGGVTKLGVYIGPSFDYNLSPKLYLKTDILGEFGNVSLDQSTVKLQSYYLDVSMYYNLFKIKDFMYLNAGLGVQGQYAILSDSKEGQGSLSRNIPGFGFYASPELEFFLSDRFVAMLNYRQAYYIKNEFGKNVAFYGAGLKFNL